MGLVDGSWAVTILLMTNLQRLIHLFIRSCDIWKYTTKHKKIYINIFQDDAYVCVSAKIPAGRNYITKYEALASAGTAHHLLVYGCDEPGRKQGTWYVYSSTVIRFSSYYFACLYHVCDTCN